MKKFIICVLLSFGLFGSSAVAATPDPTSPKCLKFKKEVLSDEARIKQLYQRYEPAEWKKGSSFSTSKFNSYYSKLEDYNDFAIKAYGNMKKYPECFTKKEFEVVTRYSTSHVNFKKFISKDFVLKNGFTGFEVLSVYGGKL